MKSGDLEIGTRKFIFDLCVGKNGEQVASWREENSTFQVFANEQGIWFKNLNIQIGNMGELQELVELISSAWTAHQIMAPVPSENIHFH